MHLVAAVVLHAAQAAGLLPPLFVHDVGRCERPPRPVVPLGGAKAAVVIEHCIEGIDGGRIGLWRWVWQGRWAWLNGLRAVLCPAHALLDRTTRQARLRAGRRRQMQRPIGPSQGERNRRDASGPMGHLGHGLRVQGRRAASGHGFAGPAPVVRRQRAALRV